MLCNLHVVIQPGDLVHLVTTKKCEGNVSAQGKTNIFLDRNTHAPPDPHMQVTKHVFVLVITPERHDIYVEEKHCGSCATSTTQH